jgi:hypothetical protein
VFDLIAQARLHFRLIECWQVTLVYGAVEGSHGGLGFKVMRVVLEFCCFV